MVAWLGDDRIKNQVRKISRKFKKRIVVLFDILKDCFI